MINKTLQLALLLSIICLSFFSCEKKSSTFKEDDFITQVDTIITEEIMDTISSGISYFHNTKVSSGLLLINDAAANSVYLMNKNGQVQYQWPLNGQRLGNNAFLLPSGQLLTMLEVEDPKIQIGGFGGKVALLNKDGSEDWSFTYSTDNYILHHDALLLPNGNILTMVWERKTIEESVEAGYALMIETFPDGLIEIDPLNNTIVWEWYVWDHLIQDADSNKLNYGNIALNPHRINVNHVTENISGDITHANGIAYDQDMDVIYLSVNNFSEIWVIDHSTNTEEASSTTGGNFEKGGDLLYRFGNPSAYNNPFGKKIFSNNHFPNLLQGKDKGKMLVFSNGGDLERSTVYEIKLPEVFSLKSNTDNEPQVVWTFTNKELFAPRVSGADKLPNGNVLIAEGDFGLWEVTQEKEVVWQFEKTGFYWRAYHYNNQDEAIINLNLN